MKCPRCNSNSFVTFYDYDDPKCTACGHTGYKISSEVLQEYSDQLGEVGGGVAYIKKNAKKYH
mgnify:CR=1 FL=1